MYRFGMALLSVVVSSSSFAATLSCWKTNFLQARTPFMTAEIVSPTQLKNIVFHYKQEENVPTENQIKTVTAKRINSVHSKYDGNNQYDLSCGSLILPVDLANSHLKNVFPRGIGMFTDENGVLIQFGDDGEGGNHFSTRLKCSSDI